MCTALKSCPGSVIKQFVVVQQPSGIHPDTKDEEFEKFIRSLAAEEYKV